MCFGESCGKVYVGKNCLFHIQNGLKQGHALTLCVPTFICSMSLGSSGN
jgi:hypothetical protein